MKSSRLVGAACAVVLLSFTALPAQARLSAPSAARRQVGQAPAPRRPPRPVIDPVSRLHIVPTCTEVTTNGEIMRVELSAPLPGDTTSSYEPNCPTTIEVNGTAGVGLLLSDFYFIIDSSGSTGRCSGSDIDEDGDIGYDASFPFSGCSDPDDTVLHAEVKAVREFVATLSPLVSRVAIIQFSMPEGTGLGERQRIVASLTSSFVAVNAALDEILLFGSAGATDYGGALDLLLTEQAMNGQPLTRRQFSYFLSDGVPTYPQFPHGSEDPPDSQWAIDQTEIAASRGIRIDTFGVGFLPSVTADPIVPSRCVRADGTTDVSTLECMALITGGDFFASTDPAAIVDRIRQSQPAGIDSVTVFNDTTGDSVLATRTPDGRFDATLPLALGEVNHLRVIAVAEDGTTCELETDFLALCFAAGCAPLTQGYWHRQCLGLGLIPTGGPGQGGPGPHPDWDPQTLMRLMAAVVDPKVQALGSPADTTTCEGLDAVPQDDPCQRAIKQYTAVLMNMAGGRLGPACVLELPGLGMTDPASAEIAIATLIRTGLAGNPEACKLANDLADLINTGAAVR